MKRLLIAALALLPLAATTHAQRIVQPLGRGVVAVTDGSKSTVTWRRLAQEPENAKYNVYINGSKVTSEPLSNTNWQTTASALPVGAKVAVTLVANGQESPLSEAFEVKSYHHKNAYMSINFQEAGSPLKSADYTVNFVWPVDLNGNGEMDYVVNRKSNTNGLDCYVEGYLASGEHLWTVKLGPNELSCAGQADQIVAFDFDCDGFGDVMIQSSDGTQFWDASKKAFGLYVNGNTTGDTDGDGIIDYETQTQRNPPRYISIIDGLTGAEKTSLEQSYNQHYNRDNRAELMGEEYNKHTGHMGVVFLDGIHPAMVMEWCSRDLAKNHHYYNLAVGYDFAGGKATKLKEYFNAPTGGPAFHQIRCADVDGDGFDEMIVGGYTMDHDGSTLFNTGISHGDRFRTSDIDPERPGLETYAIQQNAGDMLGAILYDAATGESIKRWYMPAVGDVGRGEAIDITPDHKGWEMWCTMDGNVYNAQGDIVKGASAKFPTEGIWWDGELDREMVNSSDSHYNVFIEDFFRGRLQQIANESGWRYQTVYAKRGAFWGDIIGDWREELILLHKENNVVVGIVGVTTDIPTDIDNIYCLWQDQHYQGDCTTRGYYQSPNPGFYLGYDMPRPQLPPVMVADLVASSTASGLGSGASGYTDYSRTAPASYADGKSVMLDLYSPKSLTVSGAAKPSKLYAMPVKNQTVALTGSGSLAGDMDLWKSQQGTLQVDVPMQYTGTTYISEGVLEVNNAISGNVELRALGTLAGNATVGGSLILEGALHHQGGRLMPATASTIGTITLKKGLDIDKRLFAEMNLSNADGAADLIHIDGDLKIADSGLLVFTLVPDQAALSPQRFKLIEYTGSFSGSLDKVGITGLQGLSCNIVNEANALWLVVNDQRAATDGVRWSGAQSDAWDYQTKNFSIDGAESEFVAGDAISFGDDAASTTITVSELMPVKNVVFDNDTKTLTLAGQGGITGDGKLVKTGKGQVNLDVTNSDYTGATVVSGGILRVKSLADAGLPSSIGAASAEADNFQINDATLDIDNQNASTNRGLKISGQATIKVLKGTAAIKGRVEGDGTLVKTGAGQLNLTYDGANTYAATILRGGTLAMGTWRSTFGNATSPITAESNSTITLFDNNSQSATPVFNNALTINEGVNVTMNTGKRIFVRGSLHGTGTLKISFPYVRGDFETDCSDFEGTLEATGAAGSEFRLSQTLEMKKGTLVLAKGVRVAHVKGGSANEEQRTSNIGALKSNAEDATLNSGTWNVGYNGLDTKFAGVIAASSKLNKYGQGALTLSGSSPAPMSVHEGVLDLCGGNTCSTTVTVYEGGAVSGEGSTRDIALLEGGALINGTAETHLGSLTVLGDLTGADKSVLEFTLSDGFNDPLIVKGKLTLTNPVIKMTVKDGNWQVGEEYQLFDCGDITINGTPTFPDTGYTWDASKLASDGTVTLLASGIHDIDIDSLDSDAVVYDLQGLRLQRITRSGFYIVNGTKVYVRI